MSIIGNFVRNAKADTYTGEIVTLTFSRSDVQIKPNEKPGDKRPDYRVVGQTTHGPVEFGAAWKRTSEGGRDYLSVEIDDPALSSPLNSALFTAEGGETATLVWTRPKPRKKS
jgi:uncharacterized protein (DUF736 family)